ncbi:MAG: hypothetical protein DDT29_02556 [Dehalococcoidia bacterium]|nr:hypothetical protein [Bacillota bacterium]
MPIPEIERLNPRSTPEQVDEAISACIAAEVRLGKDQQQAVAMCHEMARAKTGKRIAPQAKRFPTMPGPPRPF